MSLQPPVFPAEPTRFALTKIAITRLSGQDRVKYLQGQVTCDVNALQPGQSTLGGHCDPKGKLWSDFRLLCLEESLLLLTTPSVLERQLPELKKFAVFSKVEIAADERHATGLAGKGTDAWVAAQFGLEQSGLVAGGMAVKIEQDRWLLVSSEQADALPAGDESLWWGLEIKAGLPHMEAMHQGEFIPQMLNLQALDGICFNKGCYMGQETVARAKYRGANNRALFLLAGSASEPVNAGDTLEIQLGDNWRRSGMVLNAWQHQGQVWLTAVLPKDTEADARFRLKQEESSQLTLQPLPYELTE
ncbi:tRNA-modifying protein YgfZ [Aeromonas jandaei]|uniref:tRNA-modifying protein YgfZ n=1 Tax=Aeromonas jandaei TaxID=650 RepID=A0A7T4DMS5_AERJA|nr:tRNA-modifying protein YgfZ [Aeromonas jandaei]QQB18832.1 tRNA-modifying protein YgfZ [Aeromonas jandaei]UCA33506.1 tRNA-modifying protein YgfZ [Aeromonas jandaei]